MDHRKILDLSIYPGKDQVGIQSLPKGTTMNWDAVPLKMCKEV